MSYLCKDKTSAVTVMTTVVFQFVVYLDIHKLYIMNMALFHFFSGTTQVIGLKGQDITLACSKSQNITLDLAAEASVPMRTVVWRKCKQCVGDWPKIGTATAFEDGTSSTTYEEFIGKRATNISVLDGSLSIKELRYDDEAMYMCEFTSHIAKRIELQLYVYGT